MRSVPSVGDIVYIVVMAKNKVVRGKISLRISDSQFFVETRSLFKKFIYTRKIDCIWTSKEEALAFYETNKMNFMGMVK